MSKRPPNAPKRRAKNSTRTPAQLAAQQKNLSMAGRGRVAGTRNKFTTGAKLAIESTFEQLGGVAALTKWARANPESFYTKLWARLLPAEIARPQGPLVNLNLMPGAPITSTDQAREMFLAMLKTPGYDVSQHRIELPPIQTSKVPADG